MKNKHLRHQPLKRTLTTIAIFSEYYDVIYVGKVLIIKNINSGKTLEISQKEFDKNLLSGLWTIVRHKNKPQ